MRRIAVALASTLALLTVIAAPTSAITGNFRPDNDHPFVGLVAFYNSDWVFIHRCTAELLSPTVALTAGHCTNDPSKPNGGVAAHARGGFLQDVGSHYDPATQHDNVTGYPDSCSGTKGDGLGVWCAESSTLFNYGFDNFAGFPDIHDVGIVIFDQAIDLPAYGSLAHPGTVDTLARAKGTQDVTVRVSGYGVSFDQETPVSSNANGQGVARVISYRVRLEADERITNLYNAASDGVTIQMNGNGADHGGTCFGDSGGPSFWPSTSDTIVAVTSWGVSNAGCRGNDHQYRVDRQPVQDWIRSVVGEQRWAEIRVA